MADEIWKQGDKCRLKVTSTFGGRWVEAEITLASENQKSLALKGEKPLIPGEGFAIDSAQGCIVFLLYKAGDTWLEVSTGHTVAIERLEDL